MDDGEAASSLIFFPVFPPPSKSVPVAATAAVLFCGKVDGVDACTCAAEAGAATAAAAAAAAMVVAVEERLSWPAPLITESKYLI